MLKYLIPIIFFCNSVKAQSDNYGISLDKLDAKEKEQIIVFTIGKAEGTIFPATYAKRILDNGPIDKQRTFFMPDTALIRKIDTQMVEQFCIAKLSFNQNNWDATIKALEARNDKKSLKIAKKQHADQRKQFDFFCPKWQTQLPYKYKQYIGYRNANGEEIIYIQLLDFSDDPYKLKSYFSTSWISGWHDWFETHTSRYHFNVQKNLLTINEDI